MVTNSLPIANLAGQPTEHRTDPDRRIPVSADGRGFGSLAAAALEELHVPRVIISAGGITEKGLFNSNTLLVECERQMLRAAEEVWVVADSTKFGRSALAILSADAGRACSPTAGLSRRSRRGELGGDAGTVELTV